MRRAFAPAVPEVLTAPTSPDEEIALNPALEEAGAEVVETDLGEWIIQLAGETPSHIIAPAIHLSKEQVADAFRSHHSQYPAARPLEEPRVMLDTIAQTQTRARRVAGFDDTEGFHY